MRGKNGKEVELGSKAGCVHMDGFIFLDPLEHRTFAEEEFVKKHVETYRKRFGKVPSSFTADKKYGTRDNREYLEREGIRVRFKALERRRNRIEGGFGNGKEHYGLDRVLYSLGNMGETGTLRDEPENSTQKDTTQAISMLICTRNMM